MQSPYALEMTFRTGAGAPGNLRIIRCGRNRSWSRSGDPRNPSPAETAALLRICRKANMAIYRSRSWATSRIKTFPTIWSAFGLHHLDSNLLADEDSITSVEAVPGKSGGGTFRTSEPPTAVAHRRLLQPGAHRIRAFLLHCVQSAAEGGERTRCSTPKSPISGCATPIPITCAR